MKSLSQKSENRNYLKLAVFKVRRGISLSETGSEEIGKGKAQRNFIKGISYE